MLTYSSSFLLGVFVSGQLLPNNILKNLIVWFNFLFFSIYYFLYK